jgi:GAF domain-containing protein
LTPAAADAVARLGRLVFGNRSLDDVRGTVVDIAKNALPGLPEVSITLIAEEPLTVASSGQLASDLDAQQYGGGHGPCLDAIRLGQVVTVVDTRQEMRWPDFLPHAREAGVVASVSVPLPIENGHVASLNIYFDKLGALDEQAVQTARTVGSFIAVALTNADRFHETETRSKHLEDALQSRAVIDQAKGILMAEHHISADDAFAMLVRVSQNANRKVREIAKALVEHTQREI